MDRMDRFIDTGKQKNNKHEDNNKVTNHSVFSAVDYPINGIIISYITIEKSIGKQDINTIKEVVIDNKSLPLIFVLKNDILSDIPVIMGKIDVADCVLLVYRSGYKSVIPKEYLGDEFFLVDNDGLFCDRNLSYFEFELLYSIKKNKNVLVFVDKEDTDTELFHFIRNSGVLYHIYNTQLDESIIRTKFREIKKSVLSSGDGFFRKKDYCLSVLNKCTQREAVPQKTIGEYTNTSGEMNASPQSEIHILTNEWTNYDYTTMSSLTIAINTKKGVKYCYYAPQIYAYRVEAFKEILKDYYVKSFKARRKVVAWIRMAKSKGCYLDEFLTVVCNKPIRAIISYLLSICGQLNQEKLNDILSHCYVPNSTNYIDLHIDRNRLQEWINGKLINNEKSIFRFLNNLGILLSALNSDSDLRNDVNINDFCSKLELLYNMYLLCQWQTSTDERTPMEFSTEEISNLIDYFRYKEFALGEGQPDNVIISDAVEEWLLPVNENELPGVINISEEKMNCYLDNVIFIPIEDGRPFTLAYSFTLFLGYSPNGREYNESAAWYTTFSDNQSQSTDLIDNGLFMVDIGPKDSLFLEIKQIFKSIILYNRNAYEQLKNIKSAIISVIK